MKKLPLIALIGLIVIQLAVPFQMIRGREAVLREGALYRFKTRPIDPADPFQGRFVRLGIENNTVRISEEEEHSIRHRQPIHALIDVDEEGFAYFSRLSMERPAHSDYLNTRVRHTYILDAERDVVVPHAEVEIPFDRYYMEESKAPRAEVVAADATLEGQCWVNVRIYQGKAMIEDVMIDGVPLRELAAKKDE